MLSPGTYLRKRREAAGLSIDDVAARLAGLPFPIRPATTTQVTQLTVLLDRAEADQDNLTVLKAALLRNVYCFDLAVYEQLLLIHYAGDGHGLPAPQVCTNCACSWHDACQTAHGPCSWSADPDLCTACVEKIHGVKAYALENRAAASTDQPAEQGASA